MKHTYLHYIPCLLLTLSSCTQENVELAYTPEAIGDNAHTALSHEGSSSQPTGGSNEDDLNGTLAARMSATYSGRLTVSINGESTPPAQQTINIEKMDGTHINLRLTNFLLSNGEEAIPVGTIYLEGIELQEEQDGDGVSFSIKQDINIQAGDAPGYDEWLGPALPTVPVELSGTANLQDMTISIDIDLNDIMGQIIHVDFITAE